jgi:hypothetical protein
MRLDPTPATSVAGERMFVYGGADMSTSRVSFIMPADAAVLERVADAVAAQAAPLITVRRANSVLVDFECETWDILLRSRVMEAFEEAIGPDWSTVVQPLP